MPLTDMRPWVPHLDKAWTEAAENHGYHYTTTDQEFHQHTVHDTIQDYLQDAGDPREDLVRSRWKGGDGMGTWGQASRAAAHGPQQPWYSYRGEHRFPDGTLLHTHRFEGEPGTGNNHWSVAWTLGDPGRISYAKHMPEAEFKDWLRKFGPAEARKILKSVKSERGDGAKLKLARRRANTTAEFTTDLGPWKAPLANPEPGDLNLHAGFADYLRDAGDPRAEIVHRNVNLPDYNAFNSTHQMTHQLRAFGEASERNPELRAIRMEGKADPSDVHWHVEWNVPHTTFWYQAPFKDDEFRKWFGQLPKGVKRQMKQTSAKSGTGRGPVKLARDRAPGVGAGIRDTLSANNEARTDIANTILREAGLSPALVRAALHHNGKSTAAAVVQVIRRRVDPARIRYAAAWYGLLSNSPAVVVFHPVDSGEDTLHVISSPHPSDHVGAYLRAAGVPKFTTEDVGTGSRAYVFDAGSQLRLENAARGLDASHSKLAGTGVRIGNRPGAGPDGRADANARATYRDAIADYENS